MLIVQRDVTKLNTITEEILSRQHVIDTDFALLNQSLNTISGRQDEFEEEIKELHKTHGGI